MCTLSPIYMYVYPRVVTLIPLSWPASSSSYHVEKLPFPPSFFFIVHVHSKLSRDLELELTVWKSFKLSVNLCTHHIDPKIAKNCFKLKVNCSKSVEV